MYSRRRPGGRLPRYRHVYLRKAFRGFEMATPLPFPFTLFVILITLTLLQFLGARRWVHYE